MNQNTQKFYWVILGGMQEGSCDAFRGGNSSTSSTWIVSQLYLCYYRWSDEEVV